MPHDIGIDLWLKTELDVVNIRLFWSGYCNGAKTKHIGKHTTKLMNKFRVESILTVCLMRPCLAHYHMNGPNYLPFITYNSRRPVVEQKEVAFWSDTSLLQSIGIWMKQEDNLAMIEDDVNDKMFDAVAATLIKRGKMTDLKTASAKEPIVIAVEFIDHVTKK